MSLFFHANQSKKHHEKFHEKRRKMNSKRRIQWYQLLLTYFKVIFFKNHLIWPFQSLVPRWCSFPYLVGSRGQHSPIYALLARSKYLSLSLRNLWFSLCGPLQWQSPLVDRFSFFLFFFFLLIITKPGLFLGRDLITHLYLTKRILVCAYTIYGSAVKFLFLAQFPVDHLSHPVVSRLVLLFLCYFVAFTSYGNNRFVSFST